VIFSKQIEGRDMLIKSLRLRSIWTEIRWIVLGCLWLAGFVLGVLGFARFSQDNAAGFSMGDILYRTLQLVILESGSVTGQVNWMLEVARFLLPALAALTAFQALAYIFEEQLQAVRLWGLRGHVIVCGGGRKGSRVAGDLLRLGYPVVVIDSGLDPVAWEELRRRGARLLQADATRMETLVRARVLHAHALLCLLGEDRTNLQTAFQAYALSKGRRRGRLTCVLYLETLDLLDLLRASELGLDERVPFQLETFHPYIQVARQLVRPEAGTTQGNRQPERRILLLGLGRLGEQIVLQSARAWRNAKQKELLDVIVLDRQAKQKLALLQRRVPQLERICRIKPVDVDLASTFELQDSLSRAVRIQIDRAYVCLSDPLLALQTAWGLVRILPTGSAPVFVRMEDGCGLGGLVESPLGGEANGLHLIPFDPAKQTCTAELVLGGVHEQLARQLHSNYRARSGASVIIPAWEELAEDVREANRGQAGRIQALLSASGNRILPTLGLEMQMEPFRPEQIERMAQMEHERWCQNKSQAGWRFGPRKDERKRRHPDLVPWDHLPETEREKNRAFVRRIPALLFETGFQILHQEDQGAP